MSSQLNAQATIVEKRPKSSESWGSFFFFMLVFLLIRSLFLSPFRIPSGSMIPTLLVGDHIVASKYPYGWSRYSLFGGGIIPYFSGKVWERNFPHRGDVVVVANPRNLTMDVIKRVVGVPGDKVQMIQGRLYLNDQEVPLSSEGKPFKGFDGTHAITGQVYQASLPRDESGTVQYSILKQKSFGEDHGDNTPPYTVPEGHVFFMGDNWDGSEDSRYMDRLGFVSKDYFLGPALGFFFSLDTENVELFKPWTWLPYWDSEGGEIEVLKPWTWLSRVKIPLKIRFARCGWHRI